MPARTSSVTTTITLSTPFVKFELGLLKHVCLKMQTYAFVDRVISQIDPNKMNLLCNKN